MCQTLQQIYKTSKRIRIQWLSEKQESNPNKDIYIPEYYDRTGNGKRRDNTVDNIMQGVQYYKPYYNYKHILVIFDNDFFTNMNAICFNSIGTNLGDNLIKNHKSIINLQFI